MVKLPKFYIIYAVLSHWYLCYNLRTFWQNFVFTNLACVDFLTFFMSAGDLMQLKPIRGTYIFEQPKYGSLHGVYELFNLWEAFDCVVLEQNHRQGEDKVYAELLGRLRFKERQETMSLADLTFLQSRILPPEDKETTFEIYGKNTSVNMVNERRLDLLPTKLYTIEATHNPANRKVNVKPAGTIEETAFFQTLRLKTSARVMMIHNVDTLDGLTNGAQGEVVEILSKDDIVRYVLIKFDNPDVGLEQRRKFRFLPSVARRPDLTPIEKYSLNFCHINLQGTFHYTVFVGG